MVNSYGLVHRAARDGGVETFDLDFMTAALTEHFQASSRGAVGAAARERSANVDRSRDPLYNQLKMYSEVYRMLGWLRPGEKRLEFSTTILGDLIAEDFAERPDLVYGLLRQCLLAVTFPNPSTNNIGVRNHRPFSWLLLLTAELGGSITRHEMILALLAVTDDRDPAAFDEALERVKAVRGGSRSALDTAVERFATSAEVQVNTLENYTRLPVGVLKSPHIGWGESERISAIYDKPVSALSLTALGRSDAEWVRAAIDVRETELVGFDLDKRAHFANYAYYAMLQRLEIDVREDLAISEEGCQPVLTDLSVLGPDQLLYSPVQQADDEVLFRASTIE